MVSGLVQEETATPDRDTVQDVAPALKARLALASLRGEPEPWTLPEARQAGVTPADVAAWRDILAAGAAQLFAPETPARLQAERDDLKAQLALRFAELAVLTRLLEGKSRLFPRITRDQVASARLAVLERRRQAAHGLGTLQIRIVSAMPAGLKRRVKRLIARIRG